MIIILIFKMNNQYIQKKYFHLEKYILISLIHATQVLC